MAKSKVKSSARPVKKKLPAKPAVKKPRQRIPKAAASGEPSPRQIKLAGYKSFRLQKKIHPPKKKIAGSLRLFGRAVKVIVKNWPIFTGVIIVYALLSVIIMGSLSSIDSSTLLQLKDIMSQSFDSLSTGLGLFAYIGGSAGFGSVAGGLTQLLLMTFISLALIWALRQAYAKKHGQILRVRNAFYRGMNQLTQFILVLIVVLLEFVPLILGGLLYGAVVSNGIAINVAEKSIFAVIFFLLSIVSLHMLTSSVFAAYIVTLDGMTPVQALRSAVEIVRYRRVRVFLRLVSIVIILLIISAVVVIPLAIWLTAAAPYVFFGLTLIFVAIFHSYLYALYRELL